MKRMRIHTDEQTMFTGISNIFIDEYMPHANGDYVKVYLYLLRYMQAGKEDVSINSISDTLNYTEGDVQRALKYWEKEHLFSIGRDAAGAITDLTLLPPQTKRHVVTQHAVAKQTITQQGTTSQTVSKAPTISSGTFPQESVPQRKNYTIAELTKLKQDVNYDTMLKVLEGYLGHPLSSKELQTATFIFDELHFSTDLIYHLYEYCINRGKYRSEYIESVAISWAKSNVKTPDEATNASVAYNADYTAVCKAFGLQRMPGQIERNYIDHWVRDLGFDRIMLEEACSRTLLKTSKPEFKYANSILESWHKKGIHTPADIAKQDEKYKTQKTNTSSKPATTNKFNQFSQRNYSKEQYSSMEKRLIEQSRMSQ